MSTKSLEREFLLAQAVLLFCSLFLYSNTLLAAFTFDDTFAVVNNKDVREPNKPLSDLLVHDFWGQQLASNQSHKSYRPLTVLSFRFQRFLGSALLKGRAQQRHASGPDNVGGLDPLPFHAVNILLHAAVTLLVFRLALCLTSARDGHLYPGDEQISGRSILAQTNHRPARWNNFWEAFLAAALFACHPVHTEAVAGVVGQAELLCASLSILAFLAYIRSIAPGLERSWRLGWFLAALATVFAASLAKEIGITTIGAMVLYDAFLVSESLPAPVHKRWHHLLPQLQAVCSWAAVRWAAVAITGQAYVRLRSWLAVDQIVSIYRKVENPIPFASSPLTRMLSTGYLHARYAGLLFVPLQLSADWSFACIPLVEGLADPRIAATIALYSGIGYLMVACKPWLLVLNAVQCSPRVDKSNDQLRQARWRAMVFFGLMVAPFFPASNVLFYVGTFIGERLLYFPSVGFCILASNALFGLLPRVHKKKAEQSQAGPQSAPMGGMLAVLSLLVALSARTYTRNYDWADEEVLFRAAQKVCWDSAKVQLNSGILERRHSNWEQALVHFENARRIEPGYCEPTFWVGVTLGAQLKNVSGALMELERALDCKYVAVEAAKALAQVYEQLIQGDPSSTWAAQRWATILLSKLEHIEDGCDILEAAATKSKQPSIVQPCIDKMAHVSKDSPRRQAGACTRARDRLRKAIDAEGPTSSLAKHALYSYFSTKAAKCRSRPRSSDGAAVATPGHTDLIHVAQQADPNDPWLQAEWAEVLLALGRSSESGAHFQAASLLLRAWLSTHGSGSTMLGLHPVTGAVRNISRAAVAVASLQAGQAYQQGMQSIASDLCGALKHVCEANYVLLNVLQEGEHDKQISKHYRREVIAAEAKHCMQVYVMRQECHA